MTGTPRGERLHITLFGPRNSGKSSLLNAIVGRNAAIVSSVPGSTADPVAVPMELGPLGPTEICDTAGLDDAGGLGGARVARSRERLSWTDVAVYVSPTDRDPTNAEREEVTALRRAGKPILAILSFADTALPSGSKAEFLAEATGCVAPLSIDARDPGCGASARAFLVERLVGFLPTPRALFDGVLSPGDSVVFVTPIDSAAPKGRLILPQAEAIRGALDLGCRITVTRETELAETLASLKGSPDLVVTDSQAFALASRLVAEPTPLTSFSILFARKKGELRAYADGLAALRRLAPGAEVIALTADPPVEKIAKLPPLRLLAVEACAHNRTHEDIASVKIPRLLSVMAGREVVTDLRREWGEGDVAGGYDLAALCGGCMASAGRLRAQLDGLRRAGVPAINFGLFLAYAHGCFPRAVRPFPPEEWVDLGV